MNSVGQSFALNRTRQKYLATRLTIADAHWSRLRGLIGTPVGQFGEGRGLWILPCHGVHTWGMGFAIDVVYLGDDYRVVHVENNLQPWRFAAIRRKAASVLELPAHTVQATGTIVGDEIEIQRAETE